MTIDKLRIGSFHSGTYSIDGIHGRPVSHWLTSSTNRMDRMPSQNDGVAMPAIEMVRTKRSIQLFCLSAEIVPNGIAIETAISVANTATSSDTGNRVAISLITGFPDHMEIPKSPRASPQTNCANCTHNGLSMPSSA